MPYPIKSHCKNGHEFTPENTLMNNGKRACRACSRARMNAKYQPKKRLTAEERFWKYVDKQPGQGPQGECWQWTAGQYERDYGQFSVNRKSVLAHRFSFELHHGVVPDGLLVLHSCDNSMCVNPSHLRAGTQKQNVQDAFERSRTWQQQVTHCPEGHEYTAENTYIRKGSRHCKECGRIKSRIYQASWRSRQKQ